MAWEGLLYSPIATSPLAGLTQTTNLENQHNLFGRLCLVLKYITFLSEDVKVDYSYSRTPEVVGRVILAAYTITLRSRTELFSPVYWELSSCKSWSRPRSCCCCRRLGS